MPRPALLFDIGNVLIRFDFRIAAERFGQQSATSAEEVLSLLAPFKDDLESGALGDVEFVQLAMKRIGFRGSIADFAQIWSDIFVANEPMMPLVEEVAASRPCYLLSNTNGLHKDFVFQRFPVFRHFAGGVYSHEARAMKPGEGIYRQAIEQFDLDPRKTFYIDDLVDNIVTGQRLGFVCYQYDLHRHADFELALRRWLME